MAVYVVTGKLGSGKSLVAVGKIRDKLRRGLPVATNLDLNLHKLVNEKRRDALVYRIPDKPSLEDLESIGKGNDSYDESRNGLLVLDECGTWFNSRSWADKSRQHVINWFLHARKLGWDIIFLIQDLSIMDKQARVALAEHVVYCRRLDRITLPFIGSLWSLVWGGKMPLPKVHLGIVKYGDTNTSIVVERWTYTGRDLYPAYDTKQAFSDSYEHGTFSYLPPWHTHGRLRVPRDGAFYMRMTKIYWKRFSRPVVGIAGLAAGFLLAGGTLFADQFKTSKPPMALPPVTSLDDHRDYRIVSYARFGDDVRYRVVDGDSNETTSHDLQGLRLQVRSHSPCHFTLSNGAENEEVRC